MTDQEIKDNAPSGATHYRYIDNLYYMEVGWPVSVFYVFINGDWEANKALFLDQLTPL